jgi:hypothetical protein
MDGFSKYSYLIGTKVWQLTIISIFKDIKYKAQVVCSCGTNKIILVSNLISKRPTKSCGCRMKDILIDRNYSHGLSGHRGATSEAERAQGLVDALELTRASLSASIGTISRNKPITDQQQHLIKVRNTIDNALAKYNGKEVENG